MAVTKIWNIRGKAGSPLEYIANPEKTEREFTEPEKQALQDVIAYTTNEDKTEKFYYTSGINCSVEFARDQFDTVKMRFGKYDGNVAYHAYQSFREGEVTPDEAHAIGVQLAKELWGDRFQMVVATHQLGILQGRREIPRLQGYLQAAQRDIGPHLSGARTVHRGEPERERRKPVCLQDGESRHADKVQCGASGNR